MEESMEIGFECVRPIESHARQIMQWRNDPVTLKMSCHSSPKEFDAFFREFRESYFAIPSLPPLFGLYEGEKSAFLRFRPMRHPFDPSRKCCELSINIAPHLRGKGLAIKFLQEINSWVRQQGYQDILAEIKEENHPSQRAFEKAGYVCFEKVKRKMEECGETLSLFRYLLPLTEKSPKKAEVFIIAEAGSNWRVGTPQEDLKRAKTLIEVAVEAGANAVKFQTYRPETIYVKNAGSSDYLTDAGVSEDMQKLFAHFAMPYEMIAKLAIYCEELGVEFMSTPFSPEDFQAVDPFVKRHKIASYEINHTHLLQLAGRSGKPLILSTGASVEEEIDWALQTFYAAGGKEVTLLQCTAQYPASPESLNLQVIPWLRQRFRVPAGLSDHSLNPICAPVAAVAYGATTIEKHFTLDKQLPGPDHSYALNPPELQQMIAAIRLAEKMLGDGVKTIEETEQELYSFARRGVQALKEIQVGDLFVEGENIAILRPGKQSKGVHPRFLPKIVGKPSKRHISTSNGIQWGDF